MNKEIEALLSRPTTTVENAGRILGTGRNATYEAVRKGEIESIRVGRRMLVLTAPLRRKLGLEVAQ